jgi:hypothetical protein
LFKGGYLLKGRIGIMWLDGGEKKRRVDNIKKRTRQIRRGRKAP